MKWIRLLRVWWKRRQQAKGPNPLPTMPFCSDLEWRILPYEIHPGAFVIEYRRTGFSVWLRLTKAYTGTEHPRHWSLTHPWLFASYEEASIVAGSMNAAWVHRHLVQDRDRYHALKDQREEELKAKRRK